jgi:hypothetical protein
MMACLLFLLRAVPRIGVAFTILKEFKDITIGCIILEQVETSNSETEKPER